MSSSTASKAGWGTAFSVASVWFGTHVGGGFATGNQAIQYYVQYGWLGFSANYGYNKHAITTLEMLYDTTSDILLSKHYNQQEINLEKSIYRTLGSLYKA